MRPRVLIRAVNWSVLFEWIVYGNLAILLLIAIGALLAQYPLVIDEGITRGVVWVAEAIVRVAETLGWYR